ncbi:prepilin-type N-terminal cleavage/methylation domain-containing protein [Botrimarina hoheduenensis]|uniref:Uncharacterized protein n=1 Tax=Botrimarina hoheduenensis TaxID=2528000 RepID=A0A5C5W7H0_9BACT|nr:prepilin-type N-terminal cleavage/methylation domain-containing protein [Botrimarina hoheduenensis]TWT46818.1 hypothetical protein Pla111_19200 [Botrimarina hoheduenensis]
MRRPNRINPPPTSGTQTVAPRPLSPPSGMTLVELLVVIVLVSTLVTTAIPLLSPGGDARKIREASRSLNAMFAGAQARAVETGRPFGIALKRLSADTRDPDDNGVCVEAYQVETPPVYSGFDTTSRARLSRRLRQIALNGTQYDDANAAAYATNAGATEYQIEFVRRTSTTNTSSGLPPGWAIDLIPPRFFRPGDIVEIDGLRLVLINPSGNRPPSGGDYLPGEQRVGSNGFFASPNAEYARFVAQPLEGLEATLSASYDNNGNRLPTPEAISRAAASNATTVANQLPGPYWTAPATYRVLRQPAPAPGDPVQLPAGAAIDLQASGFADGTPLYKPTGHWDTAVSGPGLFTDPVMVLFTPNGTIGRAYLPDYATGTAVQRETLATTSLAILVGRRELIPAQPKEEDNGYRAAAYTDVRAKFDEPLALDTANSTVEDEVAERWRNDFNWLSLASRWVVIGAQSGSVSTVPNSFVNWRDPNQLDRNNDQAITLQEQIFAAREAVGTRSSDSVR